LAAKAEDLSGAAFVSCLCAAIFQKTSQLATAYENRAEFVDRRQPSTEPFSDRVSMSAKQSSDIVDRVTVVDLD
jgi:hypothetical protein